MATHSTNLGNDMLMNLESREAAVGAVEDRADVGHCATVAMAAGADLERVADGCPLMLRQCSVGPKPLTGMSALAIGHPSLPVTRSISRIQ